MTHVSREECLAIARLARLALVGDEADRFASQLGQILAYIETLKSVPVDGVGEAMSSTQPGSGLRPDSPGETLASEAALASVPHKRGRLVMVPRFKDD